MFQYAVVELVVDEPTPDGESEVQTYVGVASTNWLLDVKRVEDSAGNVKYFCTCHWPQNEEKLSSFVEKRSKPAKDWIPHPNTRVLKFCRKLPVEVQFESYICHCLKLETCSGILPRKHWPSKRSM